MEKRIKFYKGKITILFDEERHRFSHLDGSHIDSVTSATGKIDKSGPLMGWAINMMGLYLINNWNIKKVKKESEKIQLIDTAKREYRRMKQEAADIGTDIHKWAEQWIKGKKPTIPEEERTRNGVIAFMKWIKENDYKFIESEKIGYSQKYDFAGILDAIAKKDGELILLDFKSSKGIYPEMFFQTAGYQIMYEEETGKKIDKRIIVKFGKEDGEFEVKELDKDGKDKKAFLAALTIKRRLSQIDGRR